MELGLIGVVGVIALWALWLIDNLTLKVNITKRKLDDAVEDMRRLEEKVDKLRYTNSLRL